MEGLAARLAAVRERIDRAARRAGRLSEDVSLVAVSKTRTVAEMREAAALGLSHFGENRVQEAQAKRAEGLPEGLILHLIGHLQSNKARLAVSLFDVVHSLDSADLARRLDSSAREAGKCLAVFVQVDLAHEQTKHGIDEGELDPLLDEIAGLQALELRGLMCLPPWSVDPEATRPYFARLRGLAEKRGLAELSMGMSHDLEVAIAEGATCVRVGEALFGPRAKAVSP